MRKWLYYVEESDGEIKQGSLIALQQSFGFGLRKGKRGRIVVYDQRKGSFIGTMTVVGLGYTEKEDIYGEMKRRSKKIPPNIGGGIDRMSLGYICDGDVIVTNTKTKGGVKA